MIRLLLHVDGLLLRFGRPAPDAAALVTALVRLRDRLERSRDDAALELRWARFGGAIGAETPAGIAELGLDAEAGAVLLDVDALAVPGGASTVLMTASRRLFARAWSAGVDVYLVGFDPTGPDAPEPSRGLAFDDVPRILEEKLRVPTARPMSSVARTGGLLAVTCADADEARARAHDAVQEDPHADWTILGTTLILYTEEPDYEDRLAERPEVERLSYGVVQEKLALVRGSRDGALFAGSGWALLEEAAGETTALEWRQIRRHRHVDEPEASSVREALDPAALDAKAVEAEARSIQERLQPAEASDWTALQDLLEPSACFDELRENGKLLAVAWQSPGSDPDRDLDYDGATVILHTANNPRDLPAASQPLAVTRVLEQQDPRADTLHVLRATADIKPERLTAAFLLPSERARVRVVEF